MDLKTRLTSCLNSTIEAFRRFNLDDVRLRASEGITCAESNADRMTSELRQLLGQLHWFRAMTLESMVDQSMDMDKAILVCEDVQGPLHGHVHMWFYNSFLPWCLAELEACRNAKPVELFQCYVSKVQHLQNLKGAPDRHIHARLVFATQCCIISKVIWKHRITFVPSKTIADLHIEHAEICVKLGFYGPAHSSICEVFGFGEHSNPRLFHLAAEVEVNRSPSDDLSLTLKRHKDARRYVDDGLKLFPEDDRLISLGRYLDGQIELIQLRVSGENRTPRPQTAKEGTRNQPREEDIPSSHDPVPTFSSEEHNQMENEVIYKRAKTPEKSNTIQAKQAETQTKAKKKRKKAKIKAIPRRRGEENSTQTVAQNQTTESKSKTSNQTTIQPVYAPRKAASGGGEHKRKTRRKTESKTSKALYRELSAQYTVQYGCNSCTFTKDGEVFWKRAAHNCLGKVLLLQDRSKAGQDWIMVSPCPSNYQASEDPDDICEHVQNDEECVDRKRCPKPHSSIEKLLWDKYFRKHLLFSNFVDDMKNSPLLVRNELGIICHKYEGNFVFICKKCRKMNKDSKKRTHVPKCSNGHQWDQNRLFVFESPKFEDRFVSFDCEYPTEESEEIQRCLKELLRCGFTEEEIVEESFALLQRQKALARNATRPKKSRTRRNPGSLHRYEEMPCDDFHADDATDDADYDTDLEDILTVLDSDEERDEHEEETQPSKSDLYYKMLPVVELLRMLSRDPKTFKRCQIHLDGPFAANCKVLDNTSDDNIREVLVRGRTNCGQTFEGDEVLVEIKHTEVLDSKSEKIEAEVKPKEDTVDVITEHAVGIEKKETVKIETRGRVRGIITKGFNRKEYTFLCRVDRYHCHLMKPIDGVAPKIHVLCQEKNADKVFVYKMDENGKLKRTKTMQLNPLKREKSLFIVKYLKWESTHMYPFGYVTHVIRAGETLEQSQHVLNILHQVPTRPNKECAEIAENMDPGTYIAESKDAKDDTGLLVISIDPPNCQDVDDALSIRKTQNGDFLVGVHIADVTSYVDKDDCIDRNARRRTTTFYAATGTAYRMLPSSLSENACSLREGHNRLVLSVFFLISTTGNYKKPEIRRSIIRNNKELTYDEAERHIDGINSDNLQWKDGDIGCAVCHLHMLAVKLRQKRIHDGRFFYQSDDPFNLDYPYESHRLVEEFMILTNWEIGSFLANAYPGLVPFRIQRPPDDEDLKAWSANHPDAKTAAFYFRQFEQFRKLSNNSAQISADVPLLMSTVDALKKVIDEGNVKMAKTLIGLESLHPRHLLSMVAWYRIQARARFECSSSLTVGCKDTANQVVTKSGNKHTEMLPSHFSLQMTHYAQFTSPIRRYMDIVIHRFVIAALEGNPAPYELHEIQAICDYTNKISNMSTRYHKACIQLKSTKEFQQPCTLPFVIEEIGESAFMLATPYLPHLKRGRRTAKYSELLVSQKPEIQENQGKVILHWERRFYDAFPGGIPLSIARSTQQTREALELDSQRHSAQVARSTWIQLQKTVSNSVNQPKELLKVISKIVESDKVKKQGSTQRLELTSEMKHGNELVRHHVKFNQTLTTGTVLQLQVGSECLKGYLEPLPQMLQLTGAKYICLQHGRDPIGCFARLATEKVCTRYDSLDHYQRVWLPIIAMEAASQAASAGDAIYCSRVPVWLNRRGEGFEGTLKLPLEFCRKRHIKIYTLEHDEDIANDYLCVRYRLPSENSNSPGNHRPIGSERIFVAHVVSTSNEVKGLDDRKRKSRATVYLHFKVQHYNGTVPEGLLVAEEKAKHCEVEFLTKSLPDRRMEEAVNAIDEDVGLCYNIVLKRGHRRDDDIIVIDSQNYDLPTSMNTRIPRNNTNQTKAIRRALRRPFTVIQGPPGTGKTVTGVKLVYWFVKANRQLQDGQARPQVLYCGPSNSSVDVAVNLLRKFLGEDRRSVSMVRVYSDMLEKKVFPIPRDATQVSVQKGGRRYDPTSRDEDGDRDIALHHLIRQPHNEHAARICQYDRLFRKNAATPENVSEDDVDAYLKLVTKASIEELQKYDVIFCTCAASASKKMKSGANVRQIIVDECGMCMEPESLIPLVAHPSAVQVVLVGDHRQLQPIVTNTIARDLGMQKSLFERYEDQAMMLEEQYRMHPSICEFPSRKFYDGRLRAARELLHRDRYLPRFWPNQQQPCTVFVHVVGAERTMSVSTEDGNQQSKSNAAERIEVVRIFTQLVNNKGQKVKDIAVLSQYKSQCTEIERNLREFSFENPRVSTVVASQGGEWKYVILSLVRSLPEYEIEKRPTEGWTKKNMGFIVDRHQINVALTRAKIGLIIIGNKNLLRCDDMWKDLLEDYDKRRCVLDANQFLPYTPQPPAPQILPDGRQIPAPESGPRNRRT